MPVNKYRIFFVYIDVSKQSPQLIQVRLNQSHSWTYPSCNAQDPNTSLMIKSNCEVFELDLISPTSPT